MYTTPPPIVAALKDMLAASSTWSGLSGTIHYPSANLPGEEGTADALPLAIIFHDTARRHKYAVGAAGLAQGAIRIVIYMSGSPGTVETAGQAILADLLAQDTGLALQDGEVGPCSDPMPGARAANATSEVTEYRTITITLSYGLTA